ncbi:hypothetical protein GMLC_26130 [Geomonas limicola]|uniref:tRNA(Ile2) 2-agmatinylcytidine synthetase n=1 Tax=Geomonas limicola TaxID=2740186 RepID=A0A6V8NAZ3_9BACT|nr:hypothetical protein [Geomonas limicola]GFO69034.1 hypothetical protein GMLC_26130 [Geomonas limicola]
MQIVISIDDTDNLESRGTGEIASLIAEGLTEKGWGTASLVTRHQLLVHPDIPYTSHNSAMCFAAEIDEGAWEQVIGFAGEFLRRESAEGSDPGLCVVSLPGLRHTPELVEFGRRAKREVIAMPEAYQLAERLGVHLSEHGGTGQGIIGALAGAGLRLWGNDGRMKGSLTFARETVSVTELLAHPNVDEVRCVTGVQVSARDLVRLGEKPKTVLIGGASVLLVSAAESADVAWQTLHRRQLKDY